MAKFISEAGYTPRVGDTVVGLSGKYEVTGRVLASRSNPMRPAVFQRHGFVGLWIVDSRGRRRVVIEVRPVKKEVNSHA